MGYWDYYKGTLRDYHRDPFPQSPLRTGASFGEHMICGCLNSRGMISSLNLCRACLVHSVGGLNKYDTGCPKILNRRV